MNTLSANEAKTHFGNLLVKAQHTPVQINKNGKPVAVVVSAEAYEDIEALKLRLLQARAIQARSDIDKNHLIDGGTFFDELEAGQHD
jgi:prevent-host-death family protein